MKRIFVLALIGLVVAAVSASAQSRRCQNIGGAIMTSINLIPYGAQGATNLGPAFGDLDGSVAATMVSASPITFQHYWVTGTGDIINFKPAVLHPTATTNQNVVAVQWGDYVAEVSGGTGKYDGATGTLEAFGLVDFASGTVVFRYRGSLCLVDMPPNASTKK
jgi:hypothetical protein